MTILFWNFPCKSPQEVPDALYALARLAECRSIDLIALADTPVEPAHVLEALNANDPVYEKAEDPPIGPGVQFYTRFPSKDLAPFRSDRRIDIRRFYLTDGRDVLIAAIHFYDRRNYNPAEQASLAPGIYLTLHNTEVEVKHTRTVLFGDLNMNPFDLGMVNPVSSFGAMATRTLALRHTNADADSVHGPKCFYNPTWSRLGRELPEAPGTHYWGNTSKPENIFWHHLDQLLVRPSLFSAFNDDDFRILTTLPGEGGEVIELVRSTGKHWELKYSDHLPILFRLDFAKLSA